MTGPAVALRMDDVGAASKRNEVYGITRLELGGLRVPFPGNLLFFKYLPRGLLEVANHGYTHCVLERGRFRPRVFSGNRAEHREFYDWLPESVHREHVRISQEILQDFLGRKVETLVPPGNVLSRKTLKAAAEAGLRYVSCLGAQAWAPADGLVLVDDRRVRAFHDRDVVRGGIRWLEGLRVGAPSGGYVTVREVAAA